MKTTAIQVSISEAVTERSPKKFWNECTNYQEYEAYEDHVDSFVLNYPKLRVTKSSSLAPQGFAKRIILRRIRSKLNKQVCTSSYGEYLYGDHVDSPAYNDYPDSFYNDNE